MVLLLTIITIVIVVIIISSSSSIIDMIRSSLRCSTDTRSSSSLPLGCLTARFARHFRRRVPRLWPKLSRNVPALYMYTCIHIHVCVYIYIYICTCIIYVYITWRDLWKAVRAQSSSAQTPADKEIKWCSCGLYGLRREQQIPRVCFVFQANTHLGGLCFSRLSCWGLFWVRVSVHTASALCASEGRGVQLLAHDSVLGAFVEAMPLQRAR